MPKVFKTVVELQKHMENICTDVIKAVAERMVEELQSYINEDFYRQYKPKFYKRTESLLRSPTYQMLSSRSASIYIDIDSLDYLIGSSEKYDYDEGDIVKLASLGFHGTPDIFRPGMFWEDFMEWCNSNIPSIMKMEFKRRGVSVR